MLTSADGEHRLVQRLARAIDASDDALAGCLLVARRSRMQFRYANRTNERHNLPVDLPSEEEIRHTFSLETWFHFSRIDEIVFHAVARSNHVDILERRYRSQHAQLNIDRHRTTQSLRIGQIGIQAL